MIVGNKIQVPEDQILKLDLKFIQKQSYGFYSLDNADNAMLCSCCAVLANMFKHVGVKNQNRYYIVKWIK